MSTARFPVSVDDARRLLTEHAWTPERDGCEHCDHVCGPETHPVIHTTAGGFGADWSLAEAVAFIENADVIGWKLHLFRHNLAARSGGRVVFFEVPAPDDIKAQLIEEAAA